VPPEIIARKKQPFRAPNALSFVTSTRLPISPTLSETAIRHANVFEPGAVARLLGKCRAQAATGDGDLSNSDNMALVGVLSTQLLHQQFVVSRPGGLDTFKLTVDIDREHRVEAALS
jgi:asparagine synthase (glutamine-hydrolysing)